MKCPKCGKELIDNGDILVCEGCKNAFRINGYTDATSDTDKGVVDGGNSDIENSINKKAEVHNEPQSEIELLKARLAEMERKQSQIEEKKESKKSIKDSKGFTFLKKWGLPLILPITIVVITAIVLMVCFMGVCGVYYNVDNPNEFYSFTVGKYEYHYELRDSELGFDLEMIDEGKWKVKGNSIYFTYEDEIFGEITDDYYFSKTDDNDTIFIGPDKTLTLEFKRAMIGSYSSSNKKIKVTFDANGGEGGWSGKIKIGSTMKELPEATREGYQFMGWYTEPKGYRLKTEDNLTENDRIWENVTYYANWYSGKEYDVKINGKAVRSLKEGTPLLEQLESLYPNQNHFNFYLDDVLIDENTLMPDNPITVVAKVELTIDARGGVFENGEESQKMEIIYNTYDTDMQFPVPSKDNYIFSGYYSHDGTSITDNEGKVNASFWKKVDSTSSLRARWIGGEFADYKYESNDYGLTILEYIGTSQVVTIPDGVTSIGDSAFSGCGGITKVIIPDSVTSIGNYTFYNCSDLTSVTIANSVASIGYNAFLGCYKLVEVYNKSSLSITAGSDANGCIGYYAKNVYRNEGGSKLSTDDDGFTVYTNGKDKILVSYVGSEKSLTIPNGITEINQYAFYGFDSLVSITIPDSVKSIGSSAFSDCSSLTRIVFEDTTTWYYTDSKTNWNNKTDGTRISVTNPSSNVTYFTSTYKNYYWYKN